jgi:hypothetical protein
MFSIHGQLGDILAAIADELAEMDGREVSTLVVLASRVRRKQDLNQYEISLRSLDPYQPDVADEEE